MRSPVYTVQLSLKTTEYEKHILNKRFHALSYIHNVLVKHAKKCLNHLFHDESYLSLKQEYGSLLKKNELSSEEKRHKKQLSSEMKTMIRSYGLSEYDLQSYIKLSAKQFRKCLSSQQVQKEASRVWKGIESILYKNGKDLHFKRFRDFDTISGKTNTNGLKFCKETLSIEWLSLEIKCKLPKDPAYIYEALNADISYCELKRMMFPNGWHYYVIIYLRGEAPQKIMHLTDTGSVTGIDIGTSTVAAVSDTSATLKELAPKCRDYNIRIDELLRYLDRSRRLSNSNKYNTDGSFNKQNKDRWKFTKSYLKARNCLKSLYRQKTAYITVSHETIINKLLQESITFIVEDMSFKALQRKAKTTKRSDTPTTITDKNGTTKQVFKYKRRKRFGRSMNNRAPARFISILTRKATQYGGSVHKVDTKAFKASQYDHVQDDYVKHSLSERDKYIGGVKVQRDLYSAFLLKNSNGTFDHPDRDKCILGFPKFITLQNELIENLKQNHISMKHCFGF